MKFILPMPPSINQTYGIRDSMMYKRKGVKKWEYDAGWDVHIQRANHQPFMGKVEVSIKWFYKRDRDIDAGIKVLLDLFQKQNVYLNDRQVRRITSVNIAQDIRDPRVEVEINEMVE